MSKLTKAEIKAHDQACELLTQDVLSLDDRLYVLDNWQESALHVNSKAGAFFTPSSLARDLSIYAPDGGTLIDLCAGIGTLAFHCTGGYSQSHTRVVCVEINPDYVEVGRKIVPNAEWICGSVFDLPEDIRTFDWDCVVCNPPFGRSSDVPVAGVTYDLNVLAVAVQLSWYGVVILPQESCPFVYSGHNGYDRRPSRAWAQFNAKCGGRNVAGLDNIDLMCSSIDCAQYRGEWKGISPNVEIVMYDLDEQRLQEQGKGRSVARKAFNAPQTPTMVDEMYNTAAASTLTDAEVSQYLQEIDELRAQGDGTTADELENWLNGELGFDRGNGNGNGDGEDDGTKDGTKEAPDMPIETKTSATINTAALAALFEAD